MSRQYHNLKIKPQYYRAIERGEKTFEVRFNDRNYQVYDVVRLQEWVGGEYTGREIRAEIAYILDNPDFCKEGYVIMQLANIQVCN